MEWSFGVLPPGMEQPARPQPSDSFQLRPGQRVGSYRLIEQLGRGAMGVVYLAEDERVRRRVALKFLLESRLDPRALERFRREGAVLASLRHPGIVAVHDQGELNGRPFLVIELVEGARTLDDALPRLTRREGAQRVAQAARALGHAHQRGVVHRDVKPGN